VESELQTEMYDSCKGGGGVGRCDGLGRQTAVRDFAPSVACATEVEKPGEYSKKSKRFDRRPALIFQGKIKVTVAARRLSPCPCAYEMCVWCTRAVRDGVRGVRGGVRGGARGGGRGGGCAVASARAGGRGRAGRRKKKTKKSGEFLC